MTATEQLLVRGLPRGTKMGLARNAARHSRSVEAEARAVLTEAAQPTGDIYGLLDDLAAIRAEHLVEDDFELPRPLAPSAAVTFE